MIFNRLSPAFLLAASAFLAGCQTTPYVHKDTCNGWDESSLRIPLLADLGASSKAVQNASCNEGRMIGYSALLGRQSDGTLHSASLITWQRQYQAAKQRITPYLNEEIRDAKTKAELNAAVQVIFFADYFIEEASQNQVTSAKAKAMCDKRLTDPKLFSADGTYTPPEPVVPTARTEYCQGKGVFRICSKPDDPVPQ